MFLYLLMYVINNFKNKGYRIYLVILYRRKFLGRYRVSRYYVDLLFIVFKRVLYK